jgi:phage-related protein
LLISSLPPISKPQVRTQIETVDGRDGDIVTPLGFSAYDKVIKIGLTYNYDVDEIIEFFNSEGIVTFSNEPDKYYRYAIYEQIDFEKLIKFKTAEVTLHVQPFKFSTTEEPELFDVVSGQAIAVTNEGNTDSRPNLTIIGSGDIDVSLNGSQILSIELEDDQAVIIDSEDMNAYAAQSAIREVEADIEPIQDLNGYDSVWIGGAGKNLLNYDAWKTVSIANGTAVWENNGVTLTATSNDCFTSVSGFPVNARIPISEGETITLSWEENTNQEGIIYIFPNGTTTGMVRVTNRVQKYVSYTATSGVTFVTFRFGVSNSGDTISYKNIQIEKGSTATAWSPYENICEISGSTELEVVDCGCNLWDEDWELGAIVWTTGQPTPATDRIRSKNYCHIKGGKNYYIKVDTSKSGTPYLFYYDKNQNYISNTSGTTIVNQVISIPDNAVFFKFVIISTTTYNNNVSINYPPSDTEYHAYDGQTYNIPFVDDQGDPITVYRGSLNVTTGELIIDMAFSVLDETTNFYQSGNAAYINLEGCSIVDEYGDAITNKYNFGTWSQVTGSDATKFTLYKNSAWTVSRLAFNLGSQTLDQFVASLENKPIQVCYKLADPITVQLTPVQINNLLGLNNMYTDNSGDLTVKHKSNGVIVTDTGAVVSFYAGLDDIEKGVLLNRAITGDYDKIRLRKGVNTFVLNGNAQQFAIDKFSRWL